MKLLRSRIAEGCLPRGSCCVTVAELCPELGSISRSGCEVRYPTDERRRVVSPLGIIGRVI
jgi:hypothetical protein